jgi:tetratricopeptide (TPR) repeat protein
VLREEGTGDVSPQAATVPLAKQEARATEGLAPGEEAASAETSRVSRAELERLLRSEGEAGGQKTLDTHETAGRFERDTLAAPREGRDDSRAAGEGIHDSEATLVSSPAAARPGGREDEEEQTVVAPRPARSPQTRDVEADFAPPPPAPAETGRHVTRDAPAFEEQGAGASPDVASHTTQPDGAQPSAQQRRAASGVARPRRKWPYAAAAAGVVVLLFAVACAWLAVRVLRRPHLAELPVQSQTATPAPDARQQFDEKLAEAEALLAQGSMDEAIARLREANALDPSNTRAHRRLGELLLASGARREAIEEFRAVTRNAPEDFTAWRQLATAQFAEGLYRDAADSYRKLITLVGDQSAEPDDLLAYADALRLSGRADDARSIYQRLSASTSSDVASTARQRLAELAQSQAEQQHPGEQPAPPPAREGDVASLPQPTAPTPAPTPAPRPTPTPTPSRPAASTPAEHYQRGVELWSSNRGAAFQEFQAAAGGGNVDANYYLGLYYAEGKDVHNLDRASLLAALRFFQLAERGGQHAGEARRYAQQLEREYDNRRRRQ